MFVVWLDGFRGKDYVDCPVHNLLIKYGLFSVTKGVNKTLRKEYVTHNDDKIWDGYTPLLRELITLYGGYKCTTPAVSDTHKFVLERMVRSTGLIGTFKV